ncbi:trypco2 family protein [Streptomyces acidiscabies]|uniref:Trypsin-co-occurring domain-containing protein n=1 Tax=Streptomyces acidiscabies TaxID=42234 RepID=A0AAP6BBP8_9ACTN|nr:trypco2 family protein [Streptomyces acidiscabies]MBP5942427.1 hypothetical protein [Streptomyces sp. LBUM 1476]MBZ3917826.1 hypothetical protein [Streptomyces acidiscabies]MDX2961796.1 hypothetical protein [Streptomyces acidiscabies]MDX3023457.1 hypothetical protein [Streptomyces acidiscabies]MDX3789337.1 hypothetical protein [Streptomyces acidiscabies]
MSENERIDLASMITALRRSLEDAQREGARTGGPRFQVEGIELETTVQVVRDARASGGVRFWLVTAQAGAGRGDSVTQRMTIRLGLEGTAFISDPGGEFRELP